MKIEREAGSSEVWASMSNYDINTYFLSIKPNSNSPAFTANGMAMVHRRTGGESHACLSWSWHFLRRLWPGISCITTRDGMHGFPLQSGG
ncbi:MAG: hypothetical protein FWC45_03020, partial [Treponema sp.]|nr:hypothetical protein [Treponema sp.]